MLDHNEILNKINLLRSQGVSEEHPEISNLKSKLFNSLQKNKDLLQSTGKKPLPKLLSYKTVTLGENPQPKLQENKYLLLGALVGLVGVGYFVYKKFKD